MTKEDEAMQFLHLQVFDPIGSSSIATPELKSGVNRTIAGMRQRDAMGMVRYN